MKFNVLDSVFAIPRIIKIEVGIISRGLRLRLLTLTETLIILDITKAGLEITVGHRTLSDQRLVMSRQSDMMSEHFTNTKLLFIHKIWLNTLLHGSNWQPVRSPMRLKFRLWRTKLLV